MADPIKPVRPCSSIQAQAFEQAVGANAALLYPGLEHGRNADTLNVAFGLARMLGVVMAQYQIHHPEKTVEAWQRVSSMVNNSCADYYQVALKNMLEEAGKAVKQ